MMFTAVNLLAFFKFALYCKLDVFVVKSQWRRFGLCKIKFFNRGIFSLVRCRTKELCSLVGGNISQYVALNKWLFQFKEIQNYDRKVIMVLYNF